MQTITIFNQKGGVSKTTTTATLCSGLTERGYKVLAVDMDAQENLTIISDAQTERERPTILDVLTRTAKAEEAIINAEHYDLIPATERLANASNVITSTGKEYRLKEALKPLGDRYDYCVIDCPPALDILTIAALTASDSCIIPAQADYLTLKAIDQLAGTIEDIQTYTNQALKINGILITRYNARTILAGSVIAEIEKQAEALGTSLYKAKIRECVAVREAQLLQQDIFTYSKYCNAAIDYNAFIDEFLERQRV